MPAPTTSPTTRGQDAYEYLCNQGIEPRIPTARSSDYGLVMSDPFGYYLYRRLGLVDSLRYSEALSRGSWFHVAFELMEEDDPVEQQRLRDGTIRARKEELREACAARGMQEEATGSVIEREERDAQTAFTYFDAAKSVQIPRIGLFTDYLQAPFMQHLGNEIRAIHSPPDLHPLRCVAQYDKLYYHTGQNSLWIVDAKTTAYSPLVRLSTCPIEFQSQHYIWVLQQLLEMGIVQTQFNLPDDVRIGGILHIAFQKPTINFGSKDRDCEFYEHTLASGPRRGQVEMRTRWSGEPTWSNYLTRVRRWYLSEGEYEHLAPDRMTDPVINASWVTIRPTDPMWEDEYHPRLLRIFEYATKFPAMPNSFQSNPSTLISFGKENRMACFYSDSVTRWPDHMERLGLSQQWRDGDLPTEPIAINRIEVPYVDPQNP